MICASCGSANPDTATTCSNCSKNPSGNAPAQAIWNPNAAANWSLFLSPAFGSFLHARNWKALGKEEKAKEGMYWFYGICIVLIFAIFCETQTARSLGMCALLGWYFMSARKQITYVKEKFGKNYTRKGWLKPISITFVSIIALIVVVSLFLPNDLGPVPECNSDFSKKSLISVIEETAKSTSLTLTIKAVNSAQELYFDMKSATRVCQATVTAENEGKTSEEKIFYRFFPSADNSTMRIEYQGGEENPWPKTTSKE